MKNIVYQVCWHGNNAELNYALQCCDCCLEFRRTSLTNSCTISMCMIRSNFNFLTSIETQVNLTNRLEVSPYIVHIWSSSISDHRLCHAIHRHHRGSMECMYLHLLPQTEKNISVFFPRILWNLNPLISISPSLSSSLFLLQFFWLLEASI